MKIAVISDTHIPQRGRNLPPYLLRFLEGVSLILHAGDITEWWFLIVYGHTHQPSKEWRGEVLYFNPGSPTDWVFAPYFSFGFMELREGKIIEAEILKVD